MHGEPRPSARRSFKVLLEAAGVDARLVPRLARYGATVLETNRSFNLTGAKTADDVVGHILDGLTVVPFIWGRIIDVGSGAGFPAIPIAIATGAPVTLVEANVKKARFLERIGAALGLEADVVAERAEVAGRYGSLRDSFTCGTARAVASAPAVAELLLTFIAPGGIAILQRGRFDETERRALTDAATVLAANLESEHPLAEGRRIVILRKQGPTPPRFPRRAGVPEKRPLCMPGSGSVSRRTTR